MSETSNRTFLENLPMVWPAEFQRFLQSNEPPTGAQVKEVQQTVLAQAMKNLADLLCVKDILDRIILDCKTVVAPIRHVPSEILLEIFHWTNADEVHVDVFSNRSNLWSLRRVCSQWQTVVDTNTGLWSNLLLLSIRCAFDYEDLLDAEKERNAVQERWPKPVDPKEAVATKLNHDLLRVLVDQSRRWKNVCLRVDDYAYLPIFNDAKGKLDQLQTLSFGMIQGWIESSAVPAFDAFEVAPNLRNVELSRMRYVDPLLPYQQLVSVRVEWYDRNTVEEHLAPLRLLPNLQEYDLDGFDAELRESSDSAMIQHNTLRALHVCTPGALTKLVLPNLEEVRLKAASFDDICRYSTLKNLHALINRSGCSIRRLMLSDVMESDDIITVLEHTSNLNELHVEMNHWQFEADEFIATVAKYLRIREDRQMPLPELHTLTITLQGSPKWDVPHDLPVTFLKRKTAEMIRDRWNIAGGSAVNRLRSVRVYVSVPSRYHIVRYDEFIKGLDAIELRKEGMNISVNVIGGNQILYKV